VTSTAVSGGDPQIEGGRGVLEVLNPHQADPLHPIGDDEGGPARPVVVALMQPFGDEVPVHDPRGEGPVVADEELAEPRRVLCSQRLESHYAPTPSA
jgi:hypothetical protein